MPDELRHLIFEPAEVAAAYQLYRRRSGNPLPKGHGIVGCSLGTRPAVHAAIEIATDGGAERYTAMLDHDELSAALISFLIAKKVPLPVKGAKIVEIAADKACLIVAMNMTAEQLMGMTQRIA